MKIFNRIHVLLSKSNFECAIILFLFLAISQISFGQTRVIVNPGLEFGIATAGQQQTDSNFGFGATFDAGIAVTSPWYTTQPTRAGACNFAGAVGACHPIEIWGSGFLSVPSAEGNNFVELNDFVSSMVYQNIYLVTGDIINFSFRHRARSATSERAAMVIEDQNQINIATVRQTALPSSTGAWSTNAGTYTFTGTSGVYRVGLRAINATSSSFGNLVDDIRIALNPLIDLKFSNALSSCEGSSNGTLFLRINGAVTTATTVAVELINPNNGTAFASDSDITLTGITNSNGTPVIAHTPGSSIYLVTIPSGNYDGGVIPGYSGPNNDEDGIGINIASLNDTLDEFNETFKFEIQQQGTNGSTNNFDSTTSPVYGDFYFSQTNNYTIQRCVCYNDANTATAGIISKVGFSNLQKITPNNGSWPAIRKSAHLVLESNNKGFVVSRMTTAQVTAVVSPQEGMIVYDTTAKCLKIYDGSAWSCFITPACP